MAHPERVRWARQSFNQLSKRKASVQLASISAREIPPAPQLIFSPELCELCLTERQSYDINLTSFSRKKNKRNSQTKRFSNPSNKSLRKECVWPIGCHCSRILQLFNLFIEKGIFKRKISSSSLLFSLCLLLSLSLTNASY